MASIHFQADGSAQRGIFLITPYCTDILWKYCWKTFDGPTTDCTQVYLRLKKNHLIQRAVWTYNWPCMSNLPSSICHIQSLLDNFPICFKSSVVPKPNFCLSAQGTFSSGPAGQLTKSYNVNEQLDCQVADRAHDNVLDGNSPNVDDEAYLIFTFVDSIRNSLWSDVTTVDAEQTIIHNTHFVCSEFCVTRAIHNMLLSQSLT